MTTQRQSAAELTIGIVGPHDLVERIMLSGSPQVSGPPGGTAHPAANPPGTSAGGSSASPARRLVAAAYRSEQEAADKVLRLRPGIDACLFASHVPYEYARRAGSRRVPATYVPLSGSALHAALRPATRERGHGLSPGSRHLP